MKVAAIVIMLLAVAIAAVPQFTDCLADGRQLTTADGRQIPMKCHWTARAELGLGLPILAVGALKRAIRQYFTQKNIEAPNWLSKEHTFEEKQALEEEELAKTLSKRLKPEAEKK